MKTTSSTITLHKSTVGTSGANADVMLRIYLDTLTKPSTPSNSVAVPSGWTDVIPSSVTTRLWMIVGNQTAGTGSFIWGNPVDVSPRSGIDGENGTNGSAGSRGNGFFTKSITLGVGVTVPTATTSQFNLDARDTICIDMGGTYSSSCSVTIGEPVVGDLVTITYFDSTGANPDSTSGMYNGSTWEAFALQIDGNVLVDGTVEADSLVTNLIVTNQIKGNGKTGTGAETGLSGFFIDGLAGEMAVGDGTDDMRFTEGSLKIPATALISPDGSATPSDTDIFFKGNVANKFTLQVAGGKGFRSIPETLDLTGHVTSYHSATPRRSELILPIGEVTPDCPYYVRIEDGSGSSTNKFNIYLDENYECKYNHGGGTSYDGYILEAYKHNSNTEVMFKVSVNHQGFNGGTIPEVVHDIQTLKRLF